MGTWDQTKHFISIPMALVIICINDIQFTEGGAGSSVDLNLLSDALVAIPNSEVGSLTWWNTLSQAIDEFAHEYQSQHETSIQVTNRQLKKTDSGIYPCKKDNYCQVAVLEFSYLKGDHRVQESVIVEIPDLGSYYSLGKAVSYYAKEKYMYEVVFPLMYQSWSYERLSPNFYASKKSEILIIQNLDAPPYILQEFILESFEECKLVFESLAQFHALSIAHLNDNEYSALRSLTQTDIFTNLALLSTSASEVWSDYGEQLLSAPIPSRMKEEIERVNEDHYSVYQLVYLPSTNFNVVLHGSLKPITVYFKRGTESRNLTACKFVDFRLSRQGSPVVDLITYLMSSVKFEVFMEHHDSLFTVYLEELHKILAERNHDCQYDRSALQDDLRRYKSYFILYLVYHIPQLRQIGQIPVALHKAAEIYQATLLSNTYFTFLENWMKVFLTW